MKKHFDTRLTAIDWIADFAENELQFEQLREQLHLNYIYTETYFLEIKMPKRSDRTRQQR